MAQLVEQRIRNAWVEGSSPFFGFKPKDRKPGKIKGFRSFLTSKKWEKGQKKGNFLR